MSLKFGLIGAMYPPMARALESFPVCHERVERSDELAIGAGKNTRRFEPGRVDRLIQRLGGAPLNIGRQAAVALPPVLCPPA